MFNGLYMIKNDRNTVFVLLGKLYLTFINNLWVTTEFSRKQLFRPLTRALDQLKRIVTPKTPLIGRWPSSAVEQAKGEGEVRIRGIFDVWM